MNVPGAHDWIIEVVVRKKEVLHGSFTMRDGSHNDTYTHMVEVYRGSAPFDVPEGMPPAAVALAPVTHLLMRMGEMVRE